MLNLEDAFNKFENEWMNFDHIESPPSHRPELCALMLLDRLVPGSGGVLDMTMNHEIEICIDMERFAAVATEDDILTLTRCGVCYDADRGTLVWI